MAKKLRKCIRYRFDVDFSSLDGTDAFNTRLNPTKQGFSSLGTMLAMQVLVSNGFVRQVVWHPFATKTGENRSGALQECEKTAHKCSYDVRKLHAWPLGYFHELLVRRSVFFS